MQTARKKSEPKEKIIATVTRKEDDACEQVCCVKRGEKITTFNVVNNTPDCYLKNMVRAILNSDQKTSIIIRRQAAMTA